MESELLIAAISVLVGGGGVTAYSRIRRGSPEENSIRRETTLENAVTNLLETTKALLAEVKDLRRDHGTLLQDHGTRLALLERDIKAQRFAE